MSASEPARRAAATRISLLYTLAFADAFVFMAFFPVLATYSSRFDLTKTEVGAIFTSVGVATLVVAMPIGFLTDRVGAGFASAGAAAVLAVSAVGHALAVDFWSLLGARALFGVAEAIVLTAGLAFIAESVSPSRRPSALAAVMPVAGLGALAGPVVSGGLSERFSVGAPFYLAAAGSAVIAVSLAVSARGPRVRRQYQPVFETLRGVRREQLVLAAALLMLVAGVVESLVNLLVPLQLHDKGLSTGAIGIVFSISSGIFLVMSALLAKAMRRLARLKTAAAIALLLSLSMLPLAADESIGAVIAGLLFRTAALAAVFTIVFPLAAHGAERAGLGRGAANGLLVLAFGASNAVGPLGGGAVAEHLGDRPVYAGLALVCLAAAGWLVATARRSEIAEAAAAGAAVRQRV